MRVTEVYAVILWAFNGARLLPYCGAPVCALLFTILFYLNAAFNYNKIARAFIYYFRTGMNSIILRVKRTLYYYW